MCDRSNGQQNNPSTSSSFPQFNHIQVVSNRRPNREESIQISPHFPINLPYNFMYGAIPHMVLNQNYFYRANQGSGRQAVAGFKPINELRFWEKLADNKSGITFSVMSYNVLAQDLLEDHPYLYTFHRKEALKWQMRWNNLIKEIKHLKPDILCLQEVQKSHLKSHFSALEQLGYKGLYKQRTGPRTDGCAIYYNSSLFNLIEHTTVEYNQPNVPILNRDNVAIIGKFSSKVNPRKEFIVATTHLLYNPKRQDVRLAQTQLLIAELDRLAFNPRGQYLPIIMTGDLNSPPNSALYRFITEGKLQYENFIRNNPTVGSLLPKFLQITDQCQHAKLLEKRQSNTSLPRSEELELIELRHSERKLKSNNSNSDEIDEKLFASGTISHKFSFKSVYNHWKDGDLEATTFQDEWLSVDYIFYSNSDPKKPDLTLLARYRLPTRNELGNLKIPNKSLGSDHLSLLAKFCLDNN